MHLCAETMFACVQWRRCIFTSAARLPTAVWTKLLTSAFFSSSVKLDVLSCTPVTQPEKFCRAGAEQMWACQVKTWRTMCWWQRHTDIDFCIHHLCVLQCQIRFWRPWRIEKNEAPLQILKFQKIDFHLKKYIIILQRQVLNYKDCQRSTQIYNK